MNSNETGIYKIVHSMKPDCCYIGSSSTGFSKRWKGYVGELKRGKHCCKHLQNIVNKYGISDLKMEIIELSGLPKDKLRILEQEHI